MWTVKWTVLCFCICTAFLPKISSRAITEYEGKGITFRTSYPEGFETNRKYFGRSCSYFCDKLVETSESNRWTIRGRFAIFDNTSARVIVAAILNLTMEDSGSYTVAVEVKMMPDPDAEIELTVMRAEAQKTTTPPQRLTTPSQRLTTPSQRLTTPSRVDVHNTNIPANITAQNRPNTGNAESHLRLMTVLMVVCVCTFLLVCPFSVFKVLKSSSICKLSVSVSYHIRNKSTQVTEEYVTMDPGVLPNSLTDKCMIGKDIQRHINAETNTDACYVDVPLQDLDPIYTQMNPNLVQESIYQTIDLND